jgi:zinc resistance-associated protein
MTGFLKSTTLKLLAATLVIVVGGFAFAQQPPGRDGGFRFGRGMPASPEVVQRMVDGRIAGAKAALRLTPEQETLWPAVEQAVRDGAAKRMRVGEERRGRREAGAKEGKRPDMLEMIERGSERTAEISAGLKRFGEALRPLYATLSDDQKQVLSASLKPMRMGAWGGRHGRHGG